MYKQKKISHYDFNQYNEKQKSYEKLTVYIKDHDDYSENNEWGCHEILSMFHEIVLTAKILIANKFEIKVTDHSEIQENLYKLDEDLEATYKILKKIAREARYENISINKNKKNLFQTSYVQFLKKISEIK